MRHDQSGAGEIGERRQGERETTVVRKAASRCQIGLSISVGPQAIVARAPLLQWSDREVAYRDLKRFTYRPIAPARFGAILHLPRISLGVAVVSDR
jgi:hypothetical protein